jgi:hypothetical protein
VERQATPGHSTGQRVQSILRAEHTRVSTWAHTITPITPVLGHTICMPDHLCCPHSCVACIHPARHRPFFVAYKELGSLQRNTNICLLHGTLNPPPSAQRGLCSCTVCPAGMLGQLFRALTTFVSLRPVWWHPRQLTGTACGTSAKACAGSVTATQLLQVRRRTGSWCN